MKRWISLAIIVFACIDYTWAQSDSLKSYPEPSKVLVQSLIIPGWGQVTNGQAWKAPLVYAGFAALIWYNRTLDSNYRDYRAAYYNLANPDGDQRFGPTPSYLQSVTSQNQLRSNRDNFRNQRDMSYIYVGLWYGLNVLDAYIYAHFRPFDVSDDLSYGPTIINGPNQTVPGFSISLRF